MLSKLFGRRGSVARGSIYEHIKAHVPADRPGLDEEGEVLPDEGDLEGPIRWAPGAMDGVLVTHGSTEDHRRQLESVLRLVLDAASRRDRPELVRELEDRLKKVDFVSIVDPLLERVRIAGPSADAVALVGRRLATEAKTRNGVKLGISLLGIVTGDDNEELLRTLGRHEEFTLYSAVSLAATSADPERSLWDLARVVEGWGRIETVRRLSNTRRDEIRSWILREGFRNSIMDEYLAYVAATTGGLLAKLEQDRLDDDVLTAACDIISALITNGPAEDIDDYDDAPRAVELLLGHLHRRQADLRHFQAIDVIEGFLANPEVTATHMFRPEELAEMRAESLKAWDRRLERGWTPELRDRLTRLAREIKSRPEWRDLVERGLRSPDDREYHRATLAGRSLGMKLLDAHLQRMHDRSDDADWFEMMQAAADEGRIDEVVALAERLIRLEEIATGPGMELGLGPEFEQHSHLDFVVQELRRFPGKGLPLILTALRSPVVRNRNMALRALDAWQRDKWPPEAVRAVQEAEAAEPDTELRTGMQALLRGDPLPQPSFEFGNDDT